MIQSLYDYDDEDRSAAQYAFNTGEFWLGQTLEVLPDGVPPDGPAIIAQSAGLATASAWLMRIGGVRHGAFVSNGGACCRSATPIWGRLRYDRYALIAWGYDMRRLLIASLASLALTSGSALAADLGRPYYKAPPPPPAPVASWTGCYIDGGVGYGMWNQDSYTETDPGLLQISDTTTFGGRGWLGRVGAGCDYQIASSFVIGAFGDYDFMNIHGQYMDPLTGFIGQEKESGAWAVGGRIGYLVTPSLLTYFDGGYTQARFDQIDFSSLTVPAVPVGLDIASQTYHGWFIGGGTEYSLGWFPGLFWRSEYRYASYQAADLPIIITATGTPSGLADNVRKTVQTITTGLVWRFNFGGLTAR
jgi:outer membrane immunogenic protein